MNNLTIVNEELVRKHLKYADLIPVVSKALKEYSQHDSVQPLRTAIPLEKQNGTIFLMPAHSASCNALATKLLSFYPDNNVKYNLPSHMAYIMLFNPANGTLLCMMDGDIITAMRTAAASVVATQAVVKDEPKVLGVVGSGVQGKSHILALCEVYRFEQIKMYSRNPDNARKLCMELKQFNMYPSLTVEECVRDADIVVTATNSTVPVLKGSWLKKGCHINCVGACKPTWREVDDDCMKRSIIYADSRESAENESGDVILSKSEVYAEVGEVLLKNKEVKRSDFTFFKSLGIALEDVVAAKLVWANMEKESLNQN